MSQKFTNEQVQMIMNSLSSAFDASISKAQSNTPREIQTLRINLSTARSRDQALKVNFPFTSVYVQNATDLNTEITLIPNNNSDASQGNVTLKKRDSMVFERGINGAYLFWDAQGDKEIILKFFVTGKFQNGSLIIDDANTPARLQVGNASADLDGFSVMTRGTINMNSSEPTSRLYPVNDNSFDVLPDDFNFTLNGNQYPAAFDRQFKCPQGFKTILIGTKVSLRGAIPSASTSINLGAVPNGSIVANTAAINASYLIGATLGNIGGTGVGGLGAGTHSVDMSLSNGFGGYLSGVGLRNRIEFYENEVPIIYADSGSLGMGFFVEVECLFRLERLL